MSSWEGISEFVAVADTSSFTKAAERLNTSVANVSRRISSLEARLAVKLFIRTTRKVSLTEAGGIYYSQCKQLVDGLEQADRAITTMQSVPKGKLTITAPVTYGEKMVAPCLHGFLQRYPALELELILTNKKLDMIERGIDLAIRLGQLDDSSFIAKKLRARTLHVCGSPEYFDQHGFPHALSELSQHQCLVGTHDHWRFKDHQTAKTMGIHGRVRCNSGMVLLDAALKGMGIAQLPDFYVKEYLDNGRLMEVLTRYRDDREGVWALYPQNHYMPSKVRFVIDYLFEFL